MLTLWWTFQKLMTKIQTKQSHQKRLPNRKVLLWINSKKTKNNEAKFELGNYYSLYHFAMIHTWRHLMHKMSHPSTNSLSRYLPVISNVRRAQLWPFSNIINTWYSNNRKQWVIQHYYLITTAPRRIRNDFHMLLWWHDNLIITHNRLPPDQVVNGEIKMQTLNRLPACI